MNEEMKQKKGDKVWEIYSKVCTLPKTYPKTFFENIKILNVLKRKCKCIMILRAISR